MATIADFVLPSEEFALYQTFTEVEDARFETVRVAAHDRDRVLPLLWGNAPESGLDALSDALRADPSVENLDRFTTFDEEALYEMDWVSEIPVLIDVLVERNATILAAHGRNDSWHFRALFQARDDLSATYEYCRDNDLTLDIRTVRNLDAPGQGEYGLTSDQRDSLVTAFEHGYYDVPRGISLTDLADEIAVSHQALSERLRRGHHTLIEGTLIVGRPTDLEQQNPPSENDLAAGFDP